MLNIFNMLNNNLFCVIPFSYNFLKIIFTSCQRKITKGVIKKTSRAEFRANTANVFRQEKTYNAVIKKIFNASPTIKILQLFVKEPGFSFKAGQWVDFSVPGIPEVTGYSMTSPPNDAKNKGILELAVKFGAFPPTYWVHTKCTGGEEVQIRVGGDFYYDPKPGTFDEEADLLLIGGGVGINPMVSILCEYSDLMHSQNTNNVINKKVHLLYSAKKEEELVFKDTFMLMEQKHSGLTCYYFVTRQLKEKATPGIKYSRIQEEDVINSLNQLQRGKTLCFICGPSNMTDEVAKWLQNQKIHKENIKYEKWW